MIRQPDPYYTDLVVGFDAGDTQDTWVLMGRDPAGNLCIINSSITRHDESTSRTLPTRSKINQENTLRTFIRRVFSRRPRTHMTNLERMNK